MLSQFVKATIHRVRSGKIVKRKLAWCSVFALSLALFSICGGGAPAPEEAKTLKTDTTPKTSNIDHQDTATHTTNANPKLEDIALEPGWSCDGFIYENDIWMRISFMEQGEFDFRVGPGGSIAELRDVKDGNNALISRPDEDEPTDGVVQWTWLSNSVKNALPNLPEYEWRFNLAQAGTLDALISPTLRVDFDANNCRLDVYSRVQDQWKREQRSALAGSIISRTRYQVAGPGGIIIRRTLLIEGASLNGRNISLSDEYLEAWTPFNQPLFNSLALQLDEKGAPTHWYQTQNNFPNYPAFDVSTTPGYASVFNSDKRESGVTVGVVFGKQHLCSSTDEGCQIRSSYVLNSLEWNSGIGVLPALKLGKINERDVIDQYLVLQPDRGLNAMFKNKLETWADLIEAPRHYSLADSGRAPNEINNFLESVNLMEGIEGSRSIHLAPLISGISGRLH